MFVPVTIINTFFFTDVYVIFLHLLPHFHLNQSFNWV